MQSGAPRKERGVNEEHISLVMQTSTGRDKVCGLLQYLIQLYEISLRNNEAVLFAEKFARAKVCQRIVKSISSSRKMLRFMKFIQAIRKFIRYSRDVLHLKLKKINIVEFVNDGGGNGRYGPSGFESPPRHLDGAEEQAKDQQSHQSLRINFQGILKLMRLLIRLLGHVTAIFFYILDDIVLFAQLKLINPHLIDNQIKWVHLRNYFALWKNLFHIANSVMLMYSLNVQESKLDEAMQRPEFQDRIIRNKPANTVENQNKR